MTPFFELVLQHQNLLQKSKYRWRRKKPKQKLDSLCLNLIPSTQSPLILGFIFIMSWTRFCNIKFEFSEFFDKSQKKDDVTARDWFHHISILFY